MKMPARRVVVALILWVSLLLPSRSARAVDVSTVLSIAACAAGILALGVVRHRLRVGQTLLDRAVESLMELRCSNDPALREIFTRVLRAHPHDFEMFYELVNSPAFDNTALLKRLTWHVALLENPDPTFERWLDFEEFSSTREIWRALRLKGWKVVFDDTGQAVGGGRGGDSLFTVMTDVRTLCFRTVPYLNSGPVVAAWAVHSAHAAETVFYHRRNVVEEWAAKLYSQVWGEVPSSTDRAYVQRHQEILRYLQKSDSWKNVIARYPRFRAAHPEQGATFWDLVLPRLKDERARNAHVLFTLEMSGPDGAPYPVPAEVLIDTSLEAILAGLN